MESKLVAYKYDTDKPQLYLKNYEQYFKSLVNQDINLFELGIYKGGSLLMWRDFFKRGKIIGLDLNHVDVNDQTNRIHTYQGDQRDVSLLDRIMTECVPEGFDVIIDDASHIAEHTKISFWHLFENHLKPGGIYVIEDWRVGYWEAWPDGKRYESLDRDQASPLRLFRKMRNHSKSPLLSHSYGMVGLIKQLMDELGMDAITNPLRKGPPPQRFPKFQHMQVFPGQVFIVKATKKDDELVAEPLHGATKRD